MTDDCAEVLRSYDDWLESWARPATRKARERLARSRLREWSHPADWDTQTIQRFIMWDDRKQRRRSEWTQSTYYSHLRDFTQWCMATGVVEVDPMVGVKKTGKPTSLPRPLTDPEIRAAMAAGSTQQKAWLLLALLAGLRAHEIAKIRGEDISERALYVEGKGGKRAAIPLHPDLWQLAQEFPRRGWWFPTDGPEGHVTAGRVSASISKLFDDLGIDGSIHRARHAYGTRLVRAGVDLRRVQTLMRHSNLATTAIYTAVEDDGLRDAIHLLPSA